MKLLLTEITHGEFSEKRLEFVKDKFEKAGFDILEGKTHRFFLIAEK